MGSSNSKPHEDEAEPDARLRPLLGGDDAEKGDQRRDVRDDAAATTHQPATTEDAAREVVAIGVEIASPPLEGETQSKVEKVEDEAEKDGGSDVREVGIRDELRWAWILFQGAWLAMLAAFGAHRIPPMVLVPSAVVLWLIACVAKGNIVEEFRLVDFFPLVAWEVLFCLDSIPWVLWVPVLLTLLVPILCCCVYTPSTVHQRLIIILSGRLDAFERLLEKIMGPIPEDKVERAEEVVAIENLDRLEDLSKKGQLKKPHGVLAVLVGLGVWQVAFLYYMHHSVIPNKEEMSGQHMPPMNDFVGGVHHQVPVPKRIVNLVPESRAKPIKVVRDDHHQDHVPKRSSPVNNDVPKSIGRIHRGNEWSAISRDD